MSYHKFNIKNIEQAKDKIDYWLSRVIANYQTEHSSSLFRETIEVCEKIDEQIDFNSKDYFFKALSSYFNETERLDLELVQNIILEYELPKSDEELERSNLRQETKELIERYSFEYRQRSTQANYIDTNTLQNISKAKRRNMIFGVIFIVIAIVAAYSKLIVRTLT